MNTIYNQGADGTCVAFSIFNCLESQLNVEITQEYAEAEIKRLGEEGKDITNGTTLLALGTRMKIKPLAGCKVKTLKKIWSDGKRLQPTDIIKINQVIKDHQAIIGLKIRTGKPTLKLKNYVLVPYKTEVRDGHALFVESYDPKKKLYCIENSWGDFGKNGKFYIKESDFLTEVEALYQVEFVKA